MKGNTVTGNNLASDIDTLLIKEITPTVLAFSLNVNTSPVDVLM